MHESRRTEFELLLIWLSFVGLLLFAGFVAWNEGLVALLLAGDKSRISILIAMLYVIGFVHCARQVLYVARETEHAERFAAAAASGDDDRAPLPATSTLVGAYLADVLRSSRGAGQDNGAHGNLPEIYAGRVKGPNELGWFLTDVMLKLGLLGTIIGFILMLGSVAGTSSLDANTMQKVLRQMSIGMGTALYTTLTGLLASLTLGAQFQLLERSADRLLARIVHLAEVHVLPTPEKA